MKKFCALLLLLLCGCLLASAPALAASKGKATATPGPAQQEKSKKTAAKATAAPETEEPFLAPGETPQITASSYRSENVAITITSQRVAIPINAKKTEKSDVYVVDIRVKNIESFCRACPNGRWHSTPQQIRRLSESANAIVSMSGDSSANLSAGWVIVNGKVARDGIKYRNRVRDLGILYKNGEFKTVLAQEIDSQAISKDAQAGKIWQLFLFGPRLLDDSGHAMTKFNSKVNPVNPRSVIGYYEPGHYCFVQVDGRNTSSKLEPGRKNRGLTLANLSKFMEGLGCKAAYNLDGGRTSQLYFNGKVISTPEKGGRKLGDIVLVREPGGT